MSRDVELLGGVAKRPWFKPAYPAVLLAILLSGCASFSPDGGMTVVANVAGESIGKDVVSFRTEDDAERAKGIVQGLLRRNLTVDTAVQIALLNNRGLQAAYNELALAEADLVGESLPLRSEIARQRFQKAQLRAAEETLRLAADVRRAYYRVVAANELVGLLTDAKSTAESTAQLAEKLGQTGSLNKLDQAREQVFYAETTAELATFRQEATISRERVIRLLGLWDGDTGIRLPQRLP